MNMPVGITPSRARTKDRVNVAQKTMNLSNNSNNEQTGSLADPSKPDAVNVAKFIDEARDLFRHVLTIAEYPMDIMALREALDVLEKTARCCAVRSRMRLPSNSEPSSVC
jgi:hypothetical protein